MSLRTLVHAFPQDITYSIGTSASHRASAATSERYNAIRTFFKRQAAASIPSSTQYSAAYRVNNTTARPLTGFQQHALLITGRPIFRPFCASAGVRQQASEEKFSRKQPNPPTSPQKRADDKTETTVESSSLPNRFDNYPRFLQRLALSVPNIHRPTRDDLLNVASGFWQRTRIRFRWFTIKSFRKFNADDISAFVTWFLMSQTLWILVGTTTFFSVIFAIANSLRLQEYVARAISDYLTSETGVKIIFESAIVPKWKDSRISFKNVYVSQGPVAAQLMDQNAGHNAAIAYDISNHPVIHGVGDDDDELAHVAGPSNITREDTNYPTFDLTIDSVDVTLSLWRWLDGKGLVEDAVIKGVRGVLDRRSIYWDPEHPLDPKTFRHIPRPGDFELESLQLEDVLITVYQPGGFRPYTSSIFRADIRTFRKQWMFYDFLRAENVVGQFDNCLFSLHKPQSIGRTNEQDLLDGKWSRMSRFRIDGVNIDHLQAMTTEDGPFSWLTSGKVDAVLDIKFPRDTDEDSLNVILGEIADAISTATTSLSSVTDRIPGQKQLAKPPLTAPSDIIQADQEHLAGESQNVMIDIDLRFRDLKAAVPIFTSDISRVNNALIRPIVAFMNANRTLVPIHCRIVKDLNEFDGAWTMWETGLMDEIADKVYDAMAYHVTQANFNHRVRTVSIWSLQMTVNAVLSTLRNVVDPMSTHIRELYANGLPYEMVLAA